MVMNINAEIKQRGETLNIKGIVWISIHTTSLRKQLNDNDSDKKAIWYLFK